MLNKEVDHHDDEYPEELLVGQNCFDIENGGNLVQIALFSFLAFRSGSSFK